MKITIIFLTLLFTPLVSLQAQEDTLRSGGQDTTAAEEEGFRLWDHIFWGGNIGLSFGTVTLIEVSPMIGYKITERLGAGLGYTYLYYRYRDIYYDFSTTVYGGRVFGRYLILDNVYAHAEYEGLFFKNEAYPNQDLLVESALVGGGFRQEIGGEVYMNMTILYNLLHEPNFSVYGSPLVIRGGISVGF